MRKYLFLLCLTTKLLAACHAVGPSATGAGTGADWNNQMAKPSSTGYVRGDIYYMADGSYGTATFSTADSSTTVIELRKATAADHGSTCGTSIAAGWNTATMGSSQAAFQWVSAGSFISITTDYWLFNGNGASVGTSTIGCGGVFANPPTWTAEGPTGSQTQPAPTPSDCGLLFSAYPCTTAAITSTNGCDGGNGEMHSTGHDIVFKGVEMFGAGLNNNSNNNSETYFWLAQGGNTTNNSILNSYLHNAATSYNTNGSGGWTNGVVAYNYIWSVFDGTANHGEAFQDTGSDSGTVIHHNIFRDMHTNGVFLVFVDPVTGTHNNFQIYDNLAVCSNGNTCRSSDGIFACINASQTCTNFVISNNTIIGNITNNAGIVCTNTCTGTAQNNLFYNNSLTGISLSGFTQDHNSFLNCTGPAGTGNVNVASGAANPFVNWPNGNYQLAADGANYNGRTSLGAPYDTADLFGTPFTTDRGASQFFTSAGNSSLAGGAALSLGAILH